MVVSSIPTTVAKMCHSFHIIFVIISLSIQDCRWQCMPEVLLQPRKITSAWLQEPIQQSMCSQSLKRGKVVVLLHTSCKVFPRDFITQEGVSRNGGFKGQIALFQIFNILICIGGESS